MSTQELRQMANEQYAKYHGWCAGGGNQNWGQVAVELCDSVRLDSDDAFILDPNGDMQIVVPDDLELPHELLHHYDDYFAPFVPFTLASRIEKYRDMAKGIYGRVNQDDLANGRRELVQECNAALVDCDTEGNWEHDELANLAWSCFPDEVEIKPKGYDEWLQKHEAACQKFEDGYDEYLSLDDTGRLMDEDGYDEHWSAEDEMKANFCSEFFGGGLPPEGTPERDYFDTCFPNDESNPCFRSVGQWI